VHVLVLTIEQA